MNIYTRLVIPTSVALNLPLMNTQRILPLVVDNHGCVEVWVKATPHHPRALSFFYHRVRLTVKHQLHLVVASEGVAMVQEGEGTETTQVHHRTGGKVAEDTRLDVTRRRHPIVPEEGKGEER